MNVIYRDVWTRDPAIAALNLDIDYLYTGTVLIPGLSTTSPTTVSCELTWLPSCRCILNYIDIIPPVWSWSRVAFDADGLSAMLDPVTMLQVDNMCVNCHTQIDPADGMTVILPAGQLELTDQLSNDEPDHLHAYRELLVDDNLQILMGGALVETGTVIASPASIAGAGQSGNFFNRFEDPAANITVNHYNFLNSAERRLIAEWLDVGAQYYNNPYDVPQ